MSRLQLPEGVQVDGPIAEGYAQVLTEEALAFVADLERRFGRRRRDLLAYRRGVQSKIDGGWKPDFRDDTKAVRLSGHGRSNQNKPLELM